MRPKVEVDMQDDGSVHVTMRPHDWPEHRTFYHWTIEDFAAIAEAFEAMNIVVVPDDLEPEPRNAA